MKKNRIMCLIVILILCFVNAGRAAGDVEDELVNNPGYEKVSNKTGLPFNVQIVAFKGRKYEEGFSSDSTQSHSGNRSLAIKDETRDENNPRYCSANLIEINPNKKYELKAYAKSSTGRQAAYIGMKFYDENKKPVFFHRPDGVTLNYNYPALNGLKVPTEWTEYSGIISGTSYNYDRHKFPEGVKYARVYILGTHRSGIVSEPGTVWFDDISFRVIEKIAEELKIALVQSEWAVENVQESLKSYAWSHGTNYVFWKSLLGIEPNIIKDAEIREKTGQQLCEALCKYDVIIVDSLAREPNAEFSQALADYVKEGGILILTGARNLGQTYEGPFNTDRLPLPLEEALGANVVLNNAIGTSLCVSNPKYVGNYDKDISFIPQWQTNFHSIDLSSVSPRTEVLAKYLKNGAMMDAGSIAESSYGKGYMLYMAPSFWQSWHDTSAFKRGAQSDMIVYKNMVLGFLGEKLNAQEKPFIFMGILPEGKRGLFSLRMDGDRGYKPRDIIDYGHKLKMLGIRGTHFSFAINFQYCGIISDGAIDEMKQLDLEGFDTQLHDQGMRNLYDEQNTIFNKKGEIVIPYTFERYKAQLKDQIDWLSAPERLNKTIRIKTTHGGNHPSQDGRSYKDYDDYYRAGQELGIELDTKLSNPAFPVKMQFFDTKEISNIYSWSQATSDSSINRATTLNGGKNNIEGVEYLKKLACYYAENDALFMVNIHTDNLISDNAKFKDMSSMMDDFVTWYKNEKGNVVWTITQVLDYWKNRENVKIENIKYKDRHTFTITLNNGGDNNAEGITLITNNNIFSAKMGGKELQGISDNKISLPPLNPGLTTIEFLTD